MVYIVVDLINVFLFFFFNDTATTEIYTLSLHDALPIYDAGSHEAADEVLALGEVQADLPAHGAIHHRQEGGRERNEAYTSQDRKSTRLNSSHANISYAVFCLKKKKQRQNIDIVTLHHM